MITRWYRSSNNSRVLTPEQLKEEYNKYIKNHENSYVLALSITNFRDIVATCFYDKTKDTIDEFIKTIHKYYKDALIGSVVDGDFVVITDESSLCVSQFLRNLIRDFHQKYMDDIFPVEIKFRCGISYNSDDDVNEEIRKATVAMLYPRPDSIYVQYYSEEMDKKLKEQNELIQRIDKKIKEKEISYHELIIEDFNQKVKFHEIRMLQDENQDLYQAQNIPLLKKYDRFTKMDSYFLNDLLPKLDLKKDEYYLLNFSFSSIYNNYYSFLKKLKEKIEEKGLSTKQICINLDYDGYEDSLIGLLYVTREIQSYGFKLCLDEFGILEKSYSLMIISAVHLDYIKVGKKVFMKAMNEIRLSTMLESFIKLYLELGITPIFIDVETDYQKQFIQNISDQCFIRWKKNR